MSVLASLFGGGKKPQAAIAAPVQATAPVPTPSTPADTSVATAGDPLRQRAGAGLASTILAGQSQGLQPLNGTGQKTLLGG